MKHNPICFYHLLGQCCTLFEVGWSNIERAVACALCSVLPRMSIAPILPISCDNEQLAKISLHPASTPQTTTSQDMGRADSKTLRARKALRADNHRLQLALEAYTFEQGKPKGEHRGLRSVALQYKVAHTTLRGHYVGGVKMSAFNALKQKLLYPEEQQLAGFVLGCADRGFPMNHTQIGKFANELLEARLGPGFEPVGKNWTDRFVERHHDTLQTHWSKCLDSKRARAVNANIVKHWFELVKEHIPDKDIKPHNIYGMDESGFPPSNVGRERVIGRRGARTSYQQGGADRENVTAIVTICADGTALTPTIIFKGKNFMKKWGNNNFCDAS